MSTMQERLLAQQRKSTLRIEHATDARGISARPKSRSKGAHGVEPIRGYVMHNVSLEGQTNVMPKWKLDMARHASRRKQSMARLGTPQQVFAPDPWEGVDYYEGRVAFGKPMLSTKQVEARRIAIPLHLRRKHG